MTEETVSEVLVVQGERLAPPSDGGDPPAIVRIDVPPKAKSNGWGDMSWTRGRRGGRRRR